MKYVIALVLLASQLAFAGLPPTTSKGAGDSTFKTTFNYDFGSILLSHSGTTVTIGTIPASMLAVAASAPLTLTNGTFGIPVATSGANGYLSSGDWSTFNSKLPLSYLGTVSVDIKPLSDTTYSIGSTSFNWASIWAQVFRFGSASINFGNGQVVDATGNQTFNFTTRILQEDSSNPMLGWGTLGVINMYTNKIINVGTPSVDTDAATKGYVDGLPAVFTANSPLVYSNGTLSIPAATTGVNGYLTSTDWNTFNNKQAAIGVSSPITLTTGTLVGIPVATSGVNGYLSSTDWATFNNKQATISATAPILLIGTAVSLGTVLAANGGIGLTSAIATGNFLWSNGSTYSAGTIAQGAGITVSQDGAGKYTIASTVVSATPTISTQGTSFTAACTTAYNTYLTTGNITATLPSVSGCSGLIEIQKTDASLSNIVTLTPQASDNLNTAGSTAVATTLNSYNESLIFTPSGTTWYVKRSIPNSVISDTAITITGVSANPTKPTGIVHDRMYVTREGRNARYELQFQTSNTTSAATGTGDYLFLTPFTVDTSVVVAYTGTSTSVGTLQVASQDECWVQQGATWAWGFPILYDSTHFRIFDKNLNVFISSSQYPLTVTPTYHCNGKYPVSGWKGD